MDKTRVLDIGDVARQTGTATSALRYYEELGLIKSTGRNGLRRTFDPQVVDQLALIELGSAAGFKLREIMEMGIGGNTIEIDREKIAQRAKKLEGEITRLRALKEILHHVAACPADKHLNCPRFKKLMRIANTQKRLTTLRGSVE